MEVTEDRRVKGYAIIWGAVNGHKERLHKGSCARSIREHGPNSGSNYRIKFLNNHDEDQACALIETLREDEIGLYFETAPFDDVQHANDLLKQIRSGTINNFSYGFNFIFEENAMKYSKAEDVWDLYEIRLFEISAATIPSGMETYVIRKNGDSQTDMNDIISKFVAELPKKFELRARKLFAAQQSYYSRKQKTSAAQAQNARKQEKITNSKKAAIDYNFLIKNLNK